MNIASTKTIKIMEKLKKIKVIRNKKGKLPMPVRAGRVMAAIPLNMKVGESLTFKGVSYSNLHTSAKRFLKNNNLNWKFKVKGIGELKEDSIIWRTA